MDVTDADLLALAGDDSSDEGTTPLPATTAKAPSPMPAASRSLNHSKEISAVTGNSMHNASGKLGGARRVKKTRKNESEEEGEASSAAGSPNSLDSAPMSESESESSRIDDGGPNSSAFAIDNKFYSEKDKKEIMSMSEVQREEILAERALQLERKLQSQHLRRLYLARENAESKASDKKRKGQDLEESPRKSSRQKTTLGGRKVGETSSAIEAYKRQREEKGLQDQQRRREGATRKDRRARSSSGNRFSSADAEGESDVEWDDTKGKVDDHRLRHAPHADFNDVRRATLPRIALADYCFHPGFPEAVMDCYVRLASKPKPNGDMAYELALVKGIIEKEGMDYAVEKSNGKKIVTNQHVQVILDGVLKDFHFNGISNSSITEAEVANYKNLMDDAGKPLPTKPFLESKLDDMNSVINHRFTDEELQEKLRRSGALSNRAAPLERSNILNRRKVAEERKDEAAVAKCDAELAILSGPKLKYGTFLIDPKAAAASAPAPLTQQERLHELNLINRKKNREEVRKAQLAERKAQRLAREAVQRGEADENPFERVKTYAKTHHDVNDLLAPHRTKENSGSRDVSRSVTPSVSTPKKEELQTNFASPQKKFTASGMPILGNRNMDDEIIASMDLGIDIEI